VYRRLLLSTRTPGWRYTQSEPSKRETFFNQQPANLQAEVRSYVLYNDNKYLYRRLIRGCLFIHRQNSHRWTTQNIPQTFIKLITTFHKSLDTLEFWPHYTNPLLLQLNFQSKSKLLQVSVKVMLRPTVSRPVYHGVKHPFGTQDQIFISVRQLLVCWYGAPSLTRGWFFLLQCTMYNIFTLYMLLHECICNICKAFVSPDSVQQIMSYL
jgi:hypothetical protein